MKDSYFGEIGNSFYAGPNGQSFSISKTFKNKTGDNGLDADIRLGWASPVQPGDYVIISYGYPGDPLDSQGKNEYYRNLDIDEPENYNGTIWQKHYENGSLSYELVFSIQMVAPNINLDLEILDPASDPPVEIEGPSGNIDNPTYTFKIAKPWDINIREGEKLSANVSPIFSFVSDGSTERKTWQIQLPKAYDFKLSTTSLPAGSMPTVSLGSLESGSAVDTYPISVEIPVPWNFNISNGSRVAASEAAIFTSQSDTSTAKNWELRLPRGQAFSASTSIINPLHMPSVSLGSISTVGDIDTQEVIFSLPKAWNVNLSEGARLSAGVAPIISYIDDGSEETKTWEVRLPRGQGFSVSASIINPAFLPAVSLGSITTSGDIDTQEVVFSLPKAWNINLSEGSRLSAGQAPTLSYIDDGSEETKSWQISLPRGQSFSVGTTVIPPTSLPSVSFGTISTSGIIDTQNIDFALPKAWNINIQEGSKLSANTSPIFEFVNDGSQETKTWQISLPKAYDFRLDVDSTALPAGSVPTIVKKPLESGVTVDIQPIGISLPTPWNFSISNGTRVAASAPASFNNLPDANNTKNWEIHLPRGYDFTTSTAVSLPSANPTVSLGPVITSGDIDTRTITFTLPKAWQFSVPEATILAAGEAPSVQVTDNAAGDTKVVQFSLPRSTKIATGEGAPQQLPSADNFYLNTTNGDFYGPSGKLFSFIPPTPEVLNTLITPFYRENDIWKSSFPYVEGRQDAGTGKWIYDFTLPNSPQLAVQYSFVGTEETPGISNEITSVTTRTLGFTIPKGVAWYTGTLNPPTNAYATEHDIKSGDLYLNTQTGNTWTWSHGAWVLNTGTLKGPQGDAILVTDRVNIVQDNSEITGEIEGTSISVSFGPTSPIYLEPDQDQKIKLMLNELYNNITKPQNNEMIIITAKIFDADRDSYFAFYLSQSWTLLSVSDQSSILITSYTPGPGSTQYTYSTNVLNAKFTELEEILTWGTWDSNGDLHK